MENNHYLNDVLRRFIKDGVTGIYSELEDSRYNILQQKLTELFSNDRRVKFIKCSKKAKDLEKEEDVIKEIENIHENTNHRGIIENYQEIKNAYYYPKLKEYIHKYINNCNTCNLAKYDRNPNQYKFEITETPSEPNEIIHGDIFYCYKQIFLTIIDKFTKHLMVQKLNDRNAITIIEKLRNRFATLGRPKKLILDNEFNTLNIRDFLRKENIKVHFTSPRSHTGNALIERVHGTLNEHLRIFEVQKSDLTPIEKLLLAAEKYNNSIHSVTQEKPINFIKSKINNFNVIKERLEDYKNKTINKLNEKRKDFKVDKDNEIFIENPEAVRYKHKNRYIKIKTRIKQNKHIDKRENNIHPSRIKRKYKFFSRKAKEKN